MRRTVSQSRQQPRTPLQRDGLTWLCYGMIAVFAFLQASLAAMLPWLRDELQMSYTLAGLHLSALAFGGLLSSSFVSGLLEQRLSRPWILWGGTLTMLVSGVVLVTSPHSSGTLLSAMMIGMAGTTTLIAVQALLSERYGSRRATVLVEANTVASVAMSMVPLGLGALVLMGGNWRMVQVLPVLIVLGLVLVYRQQNIPVQEHSSTTTGAGRLPGAFWQYFLMITMGVAVEWCILGWTGTMLEEAGGMSREVAAQALSVLLVAAVFGRLATSRLSQMYSVPTLLLGAVASTTLGVALIWALPTGMASWVGVALAGAGVAQFFPLGVAGALGTVPERASLASARTTLAGSVAVLVVPSSLGWVADQVGYLSGL
ncbi:MAG: MFS transporter [Chloroflexaceae bacterium]|nr:MFS transporter [Chloroflexaceae bacterium]